MLGDAMARAAGWDNPSLKESNRVATPKTSGIETHVTKTPLSGEPNLHSVAVLYMTREEAIAVTELARLMQNARGSSSSANQFVIRVNQPLFCSNGHPVKEGELCTTCERERLKALNGARIAEALSDARIAKNDAYAALAGPSPAGFAGPLYITEQPLVGMIFEVMPPCWSMEANANDQRVYLCDQTRRVRAEIARFNDTSWMVLDVPTAKPIEPPTPKPIGDAARFAGIDFDD
jgi:hypothetical protein